MLLVLARGAVKKAGGLPGGAQGWCGRQGEKSAYWLQEQGNPLPAYAGFAGSLVARAVAFLKAKVACC